MNRKIYDVYVNILKEELIPALGCTEPIAIAYASAKAREVLGYFPEHITVYCSGNIIKNVKSVIVPTTVDMKGIETSAILGALAGDASKKLEVISDVTDEHIVEVRKLIEKKICDVRLIENISDLHIIVEMEYNEESSLVEIIYSHTNITRIMKNNNMIYESNSSMGHDNSQTDRSLLNLRDIYDFVNELNIEDVKEILDRQISFNMSIATEGLSRPYGACVGSTLINHNKKSTEILAKALPAAGSDARMGGCTKPVVINSGSGNQGLTVSLPVIVYANALNVSVDKKYKALAFSNLVAIYQKRDIGKLSAFCGVVSAGCGSGAAITYLNGGNYEAICRTITNTLGNVSGIICDGAKASCAAKIVASVNAAILGHHMAIDDLCFKPDEGIIKSDIESTIKSVSRLAREGMKFTDIEILKIMLEC